MKNPVLKRAIEAAKKGPSVAQDGQKLPCGCIQRANGSWALLDEACEVHGLMPVKAQGRKRKVPGQMNKLERQYAEHLEGEKRAGRILEYYYEPLGIKLAPKTFWHPDFLVLTAAHFIELHECKGFMEDHANVKIKTVAAMFWWLIVYVVKRKKARDGGGWDIREIKAA